METPMVVDVGILDSDLLYLPQDLPSPSGKPGAEKILDDLFTQWLSLPDAQRVVRTLSKLLEFFLLVTYHADSAHYVSSSLYDSTLMVSYHLLHSLQFVAYWVFICTKCLPVDTYWFSHYFVEGCSWSAGMFIRELYFAGLKSTSVPTGQPLHLQFS